MYTTTNFLFVHSAPSSTDKSSSTHMQEEKSWCWWRCWSCCSWFSWWRGWSGQPCSKSKGQTGLGQAGISHCFCWTQSTIQIRIQVQTNTNTNTNLNPSQSRADKTLHPLMDMATRCFTFLNCVESLINGFDWPDLISKNWLFCAIVISLQSRRNCGILVVGFRII